jgi:hypothetical protein
MKPEQDDKSYTATDIIGGTTEMAALPSEPRRLRPMAPPAAVRRGRALRRIVIGALLLLVAVVLWLWLRGRS